LVFSQVQLHRSKFQTRSSRKNILAKVEKSGADVGVAFLTLDGKDDWYSRADESFHAASTMKVPVLIELFHQVKDGKLKLSDSLVVRNEFHSIVDGSPFKLDATDDSERISTRPKAKRGRFTVGGAHDYGEQQFGDKFDHRETGRGKYSYDGALPRRGWHECPAWRRGWESV